MAYAILRVTKMNSMGSIGGKDSHELRQRETLNADPERASLNRQVIGTVAIDDVKERLGITGVPIRKDSVLAIDVFATASPEFFTRNHPDDIRCKEFQRSLVDFLYKEFGKDNVVSLRAHHDETSPHWHATIVPIREKTIKVGRQVKTERTENRLCAKDWLGGDRHTLSKLQTRFANEMKHLGLERGIQGSQAKHVAVKQFYTLAQEAVTKAESIQQHFPRINPEQYAEKVEKPGFFEGTESFAKKSVTNAINQLSTDIEKVNLSIKQARQNELNKTAVPAINALAQKSDTRQSQAEKALLTLGYRLDQHGGLVNIEEERKNALRGSILHVLSNCTSLQLFRQELIKKGIKPTLSEDDQEVVGKNRYKVFLFHDGKGKPISSRELGAEFMGSSVVGKIEENVQAEKDREAIAKSKIAYETTIAKSFVHHKGSATEFSKYLKSLQPDDIEEISRKIGRDQGVIGVEYIRHRLQVDINKNELQLAADRDSLLREGYDIGRKPGKNLGIG
ncbi:MobV family relaxase [Dyadobacter sediminis]|uniref:Mobilization protein n=1 Tax=Dyadobacter sediminis TaxID=1493691 RepID=A0A5R9KM81_9BACT|nr:MobV family relaxase [Dyadobacter sediminis]TLU97248.1 hypothetical protein FEM55_01000 [Dyadobacter sediminis]GGC16024.1 hypothetical protein GCM10011325_48530 [Dyadobacter sediminis]